MIRPAVRLDGATYTGSPLDHFAVIRQMPETLWPRSNEVELGYVDHDGNWLSIETAAEWAIEHGLPADYPRGIRGQICMPAVWHFCKGA